MGRRVTRGVLALVAAACLALTVDARQVFRAGTDTVLLSVSAADGHNHPIPTLAKSDFFVFEDGARQDITVFSKDPQPIALSLLIDSSTSMERKLDVATEAAIGFCRRLGPNDVAQVIAFNTDTQILQPFTHDVAALERAIRQTRAGGSTSLYTAVYIGLTELNRMRAKTPDDVRRQAIVVLSDGEDNTSLLHDDDVLDLSKRSSVIVYAIGLRDKGERRGSDSQGFRQSDFVLRSLSQSTGGRVFFVDDPSQLPGIYDQIADELANQYTIGYVSTNARRDGAWRQVAVRVNQAGVTARTKSGYFGPTKGP
jgi:Ca-activated chloride channel family protein